MKVFEFVVVKFTRDAGAIVDGQIIADGKVVAKDLDQARILVGQELTPEEARACEVSIRPF